MNSKFHFKFSRKQRSGIYLLILIIICLQCLYFFVDFSEDETPVNQKELDAFKQEIDSLRLVEINNQKPKIFPFNPNFISDYKGYTLGMSNEEIDRLLQFRKQNLWINSTKQFQSVTKVSDSLLNKMAPYFKFPDWVSQPKPRYNSNTTINSNPKSFNQKLDLNTATANQLQKIYGVGKKLSQRIIEYRNKFQNGFAADIELTEIWGLSPEVIDRIKKEFTVKTPRELKKINLNTATRDDLVTIPYIDYEIAHQIIEERTLREGFKSLNDLTKVEQFSASKLEIIKLYLHL